MVDTLNLDSPSAIRRQRLLNTFYTGAERQLADVVSAGRYERKSYEFPADRLASG